MGRSVSDAKARAVAAGAQAELARRHLLEFGDRLYPGFQRPPHVETIGALLEAVERGGLRRLVVNIPPRHGKSSLCSMIFPAWYLGRNPQRNIIMATHSAELSERNSRGARALLQDERWPFTAKLSQDSTSAARWNLDAGGGVYACGVDGNVTGRGADVLILDDVQHDSGTEGEREAAWRWFCEVAVPRLEPGAAIVAIGTRFAEDDLFGRLADGQDARDWHVLRLPAIAQEEDPLGRAEGAALWPQRVSVDELLARKRSMGSRWFETQFQQNPMPQEGNLIKAAWLQRYSALPESFEQVIVALDAAAKTGVSNDYSALVVLGVLKNAIYVLDVYRRRVEFPELIRLVASVNDKHQASTIYVEDASNATALIQQLQRDSRLPIVAKKPIGSKISRVEALTGLFESGRVFVPREASWLIEFERELLAFPNARHDDMVDALTLGLGTVQNAPFVYAKVISPGGDDYSGPEFPGNTRTTFQGLR